VILATEALGKFLAFLATIEGAAGNAGKLAKAAQITVVPASVAVVGGGQLALVPALTVAAAPVAQAAAATGVLSVQALNSSGQGSGGGTKKAPSKPAEPVKPPHEGDVWVNTESGRYHTADQQWYGSTKQGKWMSEAEAEQAGYSKAGTARVPPPSGVYLSERIVDIEGPAQRIMADLGPREARAGFEKQMRSAAEYSLSELAEYERAHATGAGLGAESADAIRLAPRYVNQLVQRQGIEAFLKRMVMEAEVAGETVHLETIVRTHPLTMRLKSIAYKVGAKGPDGAIRGLFEGHIEVTMEGRAQASLEYAGETYKGPWLDKPIPKPKTQ
jgi:hypothetical protein